MRIERLHIEGFGLHRDLHLDFSPGLNVLLGANEAGKSTLHAFVRAMLYGLPRGGPRFEPLAGGRHGGALTLARNGERIRVERILSPRKALRVLDEQGVDLGEAALKRLLGNVDASLHRNVFAFDLDDLQELGLESDEIERRLFDAGLLGAGRSLAALRKELREEKEEVLRPRSGPIRELAREIAKLKQELAERVDRSREHGEGLKEEEALAKEVLALKEQRGELQAALRRWDLLLALWPEEVERRRLLALVREETADEPGSLVLEEALARHDAFRERELTLREQLAHLKAEREAIVQEIESLAIDEEKLAKEAELLALEQERRLQEEAMEKIGTLERAIAQKAEITAEILGGIGADWDVERALKVDRSLPRREALEALAAELSEAKAARGEAERWLEEGVRRLGEAQREVESAAEALEEHGPVSELETLDEKSKQLAELRAALRERERADQGGGEIPRRRSERGDLMLALGALALIAGGALLYIDEPVGALVASLAALAFLAAGLLGRHSGAPAQRDREGGGGQREWGEMVAASALALGLRADPSLAEVEGAALALDRERARRQRWEDLDRRLVERQERVRLAEAAMEEARVRETRAKEKFELVRRRWREHTADLGGEELTPEAARERLDRVERALLAWEAGEAEGAEKERLRRVVDDWMRRAADLLGEKEERGFASLRLALAELGRMVAGERKRANRREGLVERLETLERSLESSRAGAEAAATGRAECLREVGAESREELVERLRRRREREEAEKGLLRFERTFLERAGEGAEAQRIRSLLEQGRRDEWEAEAARAREALEELEGRLEDIQSRLTLLRRELEEQQASTAIPELTETIEQRKAEWGELILRHRKAALLELLLDDALEEIHDARQPAVLRSASAFFRVVTDERYLRIRQMREVQQVEVVMPSGAAVSATSLSRGTRDQLYLCLRLGLADAFAEQGTRLPLLMDDVLVNFDPERAEAMAKVLADAADRHQILLFTCHPETSALLEREAGANRIELPGATEGIAARHAG